MASTLITQTGKVTREELKLLRDPKPLGRRHGPVPHATVVEAIRGEAERRGLRIRREEYALGRGGATLFGIMDFEREWSEGVFALGFRASQDQSLALRAVAGLRVLVCDNLALSGSVVAFRHRHTTRLDLGETIAHGFDRYETHAAALAATIDRLRTIEIDGTAAKEVIYDAVVEGVIPLRLLSTIHSLYFDPCDERPDCAPRTLWGLHNAFTRAFKGFGPERFWRAQAGLGRLFGD
jgi:hypothetical protein